VREVNCSAGTTGWVRAAAAVAGRAVWAVAPPAAVVIAAAAAVASKILTRMNVPSGLMA
jgi:hypothetical protein